MPMFESDSDYDYYDYDSEEEANDGLGGLGLGLVLVAVTAAIIGFIVFSGKPSESDPATVATTSGTETGARRGGITPGRDNAYRGRRTRNGYNYGDYTGGRTRTRPRPVRRYPENDQRRRPSGNTGGTDNTGGGNIGGTTKPGNTNGAGVPDDVMREYRKCRKRTGGASKMDECCGEYPASDECCKEHGGYATDPACSDKEFPIRSPCPDGQECERDTSGDSDPNNRPAPCDRMCGGGGGRRNGNRSSPNAATELGLSFGGARFIGILQANKLTGYHTEDWPDWTLLDKLFVEAGTTLASAAVDTVRNGVWVSGVSAGKPGFFYVDNKSQNKEAERPGKGSRNRSGNGETVVVRSDATGTTHGVAVAARAEPCTFLARSEEEETYARPRGIEPRAPCPDQESNRIECDGRFDGLRCPYPISGLAAPSIVASGSPGAFYVDPNGAPEKVRLLTHPANGEPQDLACQDATAGAEITSMVVSGQSGGVEVLYWVERTSETAAAIAGVAYDIDAWTSECGRARAILGAKPLSLGGTPQRLSVLLGGSASLQTDGVYALVANEVASRITDDPSAEATCANNGVYKYPLASVSANSVVGEGTLVTKIEDYFSGHAFFAVDPDGDNAAWVAASVIDMDYYYEGQQEGQAPVLHGAAIDALSANSAQNTPPDGAREPPANRISHAFFRLDNADLTLPLALVIARPNVFPALGLTLGVAALVAAGGGGAMYQSKKRKEEKKRRQGKAAKAKEKKKRRRSKKAGGDSKGSRGSKGFMATMAYAGKMLRDSMGSRGSSKSASKHDSKSTGSASARKGSAASRGKSSSIRSKGSKGSKSSKGGERRSRGSSGARKARTSSSGSTARKTSRASMGSRNSKGSKASKSSSTVRHGRRSASRA